MQDTAVRKISADEILSIRNLALEIWPKAFEEILSPEQIEYMLEMMYSEKVLLADEARGVEFFLLTHKGEDCGYAAIEKLNDETCKLHKIYISQKLRGKGLGKFLLHEMESVAKSQGASSLTLNVNRNNKAISFYKSQGYEIIKSEDIEIGNGYFMNDYVMEKNL